MSAHPMPDDEFDANLDDTNPIPGVEFKKIVRRKGSLDSFELHFPNGRVERMAMADLLSFPKARVAIASGADVVLPRYKPADWDPVAQAIIRAAELVELPPRVEETIQWISSYARTNKVIVDETQKGAMYNALSCLDSHRDGYVSRTLMFADNTIAFTKEGFNCWLRISLGEIVKSGELTDRLSEAGFAYIRHSGSVSDDGTKDTVRKWLWRGSRP